jgi:Holliday junction resolvasome RuvABC ATP-dependent DNA helicase subunit
MYAASYNQTGQLPFLCITGQKGGGKSTLLRAFHHELIRADKTRPKFIEVNAASMGVKGFFEDIVPIWQEGHVLFIDECHNLTEKLQELFLTLLDSRDEVKREISYGGETFEIDFSVSSIIMATTDPQSLCDPLRSRLNVIELTSYTPQELLRIFSDNLEKYRIGVSKEVLDDASGVLRGDPRQAALIVKDMCNPWCLANGMDQLELHEWRRFRKEMGILPFGLEQSEVEILRALNEGPLNLTGLSGATGLSRSAVQFQFEQRLVKLRLIEIGQKREITQKGRGVLGMVESFLS